MTVASPEVEGSAWAKKEHSLRKYIYFIQDSKRTSLIKIGISQCPDQRLKNLQSGSPVELEIIRLVVGDIEEENKLHRQFGHERLRGEWFSPSRRLVDYISNLDDVRPDKKRERAEPDPEASHLIAKWQDVSDYDSECPYFLDAPTWLQRFRRGDWVCLPDMLTIAEISDLTGTPIPFVRRDLVDSNIPFIEFGPRTIRIPKEPLRKMWERMLKSLAEVRERRSQFGFESTDIALAAD